MYLKKFKFIFIFIAANVFLFPAAYSSAEKALPLEHSSSAGGKYAIVSGQSVVGMLAAAVLAKWGYYVDCFEIREHYTRNIQWAIRQSLVNELASIDEQLAENFFHEVASPIYQGSIHVYIDGYRRHKNHDGLEKGNPNNLPTNCADMINHPSVAIVKAKNFENFLRNYLVSLPNIHLHHESIDLEKEQNSYYAKGHPFPDLIVIAEGFNSASKSVVGINSTSAAQDKLQIAGKIDRNSGGVMIKHWRKENESIQLTGIMGGAGCDDTWVVADVSSSTINNQKSLEREFRRVTAEALGCPLKEIAELNITGVSDEKLIAPFFLKQAICKTATCGDNLILIGDAVGAGHWSAGGGMQTGAICHIERLKTLLRNLANGREKSPSLAGYSQGVLSDTQPWITVSLNEERRIVEKSLENQQLPL